MKTAILCGGYGTRIRDVADNIPKPMIPIGEYPILWHIMKYYASWGHDQFVLCLGYKGDIIRDFFANYRSHTMDFTIDMSGKSAVEYHNSQIAENWVVTLAETGQHAMTGARIKKVRKYFQDDDNFMLTYGDGVGNIDLEKLVAFHNSHGKILTVTGVRPPGRFGELQCDNSGLVTEFNEKPQSTGGRISGGFFICRKEIFDYIDDREDTIFEQEPLRNLVSAGEMMVYKHDGFWQPMDTSREYKLLNQVYEQKKAPWVIW
ncbi:MAG: glucose-1-phosphate cytidylyltransferase [Methanoregula sp.]|jgi:glucose-1-phosphate cytidylyltransferase|uniref:glucose-1-phosphate cytidylyltransferase n=1 Tax=Methanoregula sp. TaxID=2052170 RepID=UPI0025FDADAF|nr:glucose-1-phosphate cytidylyltransferase [Methanoregula sp.]MCK9630271.1 glucose-1-phosphate cytidylyltransferase [Methanoregula sp.]